MSLTATLLPQLLRWGDDGKQVIIVNPFELEASVLPRIYKQSKFSSFSRQLNVSRGRSRDYDRLQSD